MIDWTTWTSSQLEALIWRMFLFALTTKCFNKHSPLRHPHTAWSGESYKFTAWHYATWMYWTQAGHQVWWHYFPTESGTGLQFLSMLPSLLHPRPDLLRHVAEPFYLCFTVWDQDTKEPSFYKDSPAWLNDILTQFKASLLLGSLGLFPVFVFFLNFCMLYFVLRSELCF